MHRLIEEHGLDGQLRWLVAQKNRVRNGELYRIIADSHGAFVQPALYEAFGLTVRGRSNQQQPHSSTLSCSSNPAWLV